MRSSPTELQRTPARRAGRPRLPERDPRLPEREPRLPEREPRLREPGQPVSAGIGAVLDVLECLDDRGSMTLSELARETGIAKSTLHRVCAAMAERGWIARHPASGRMQLGPRAAVIARAAPTSALVAAFEPIAASLVERHNETSCLTILDGRDSVFIAKRETTHAVRLVTPVGSRLPAFACASGRAMLAALPAAEVRRLYGAEHLVTPTGVELGGVQRLERLLAQTRQRGWAQSIDETALGLHCVAVALAPVGATPAAITFCVPSGRMSPGRADELACDLRRAAARLSGDPAHHERPGPVPGRKAATA